MKVFQNIPQFIKLLYALRYLNEFKKEMAKSRAAGDCVAEQAAILKATSSWGKHVVQLFDVDLRVHGEENLPKEGPVVYVGNHQGYSDVPVCCAVLDTIQTAFVSKEDLGKVPFYGKWIKNIRSVMIKRDDPRAALKAILEGIDLIENGYSLVIFPEGTRSKGGPMKEFKQGSMKLATKPGVPIVPITINGTYQIFEETGKIEKGKTVHFTIHPAIETKGIGKAEASDLANRVQQIVASAL